MIEGSDCSLARMVAWAPVGLLFSTCRFSTAPPRPWAKPWQRCSRPMLPASWITHSALVTPAAAICCPAPCPAMPSSCPTWASAPNSVERSCPELMVITGMSAATAASMELRSASGFAMETTIPSTCSLIAASMSWDCRAGSPLLSR